ncbi:hypothetical protein NPIL_370321 [Nephila pilipes]|uniref:Uncharacterized protein n=1 Tax=Nephila pilipes TaxID=299642 RepID=A0A8X6N376_NEPPI|nr:hypothetical protein NPIL_370321 [Nephila pilipes]
MYTSLTKKNRHSLRVCTDYLIKHIRIKRFRDSAIPDATHPIKYPLLPCHPPYITMNRNSPAEISSEGMKLHQRVHQQPPMEGCHSRERYAERENRVHGSCCQKKSCS